MKAETHTITTAVKGEVWTPAGCVSFEVEAGPFSAKSDDDQLILASLIAAGVAVPTTKSTKKGA